MSYRDILRPQFVRDQKLRGRIYPLLFRRSWVQQPGPLLLSALLFTLFGVLTRRVQRGSTFRRDIQVSRGMQKPSVALLSNLAHVVSMLGGEPVLLNGGAGAIACLLWIRRRREEALVLVSGCTLGTVTRIICQRMVHRRRPNPMLVRVMKKARGKSYPSGHVTTSLLVWGWFALQGMRGKQGWWQKVQVGCSLLLMGLIGPARVYLGDHWASDVLGGYLFGGAWLSLSWYAYKSVLNKNK